jgi:hypothetical protein
LCKGQNQIQAGAKEQGEMTIREIVIPLQSMIPKSGSRFSEKIMLQQRSKPACLALRASTGVAGTNWF